MSWNVWGHEWAETLLKQHIAQGSTRHAYLFTGAPGIGRRTLALCFAKALNCLEPPAPGEFCGKCRNCRQIERMQNPDLLIGVSGGVGEPLKVDTVRSIQHELNMLPYAAKYRIALLMRFEEANANAQNALLKTLEEPPADSKLLLTAGNENALLPTIASRCEVLRLRPMKTDALKQLLIEKKQMAPDDAGRAAHLAAGRIGFALKLADDPDETARIMGLAQEGLELLGQGTIPRFAYAAAFKDSKKRGEFREVLQVWQSLFRDLMLLSAENGSGEELSLCFIDLEDDLRGIAGKSSMDTFSEGLKQINQSMVYLNANVNLQLLAENLLLGLPLLS